MHQSSCIQVIRTVKALLKCPLLLHTSNSLLGGRGWTGFINDLERYPHCDWLKTCYSANKVTFCKYASGTVFWYLDAYPLPSVQSVSENVWYKISMRHSRDDFQLRVQKHLCSAARCDSNSRKRARNTRIEKHFRTQLRNATSLLTHVNIYTVWAYH